MRHGGGLVLALLLLALTALAAASVGTAQTEPKEEVTSDVDSDLLVQEEETLEATDSLDGAEAAAEPTVDPRLTLEVMEKIFSKMSARCLKQLQENAPDSPEMSDRCRREAASRIQRYLARLDKEERGETADEQKTKTKKTDAKPQQKKSRKGKKQTRARRAAAAARKKEEEYQKTLQVIIGFVVTFVAIIGGAMFVINRKLKAAGMYYSDPTAKATCCGN